MDGKMYYERKDRHQIIIIKLKYYAMTIIVGMFTMSVLRKVNN